MTEKNLLICFLAVCITLTQNLSKNLSPDSLYGKFKDLTGEMILSIIEAYESEALPGDSITHMVCTCLEHVKSLENRANWTASAVGLLTLANIEGLEKPMPIIIVISMSQNAALMKFNTLLKRDLLSLDSSHLFTLGNELAASMDVSMTA